MQQSAAAPLKTYYYLLPVQVTFPYACPTATPSANFPGTAWIDCQPGGSASADASASAAVEQGRK
jgi:hypothetical protein